MATFFGKTFTCYTDGSFKYKNKTKTHIYDHGIGIIFNDLNVNLMMKLKCAGNQTNNDTEQIAIVYAMLFQINHILFPKLQHDIRVKLIMCQFDNLIISDIKLPVGHTIVIHTDSLSCIRDLKSKNKNNISILKYTDLIQQIISTYAQNNIFIKLKYVKAHSDNNYNNIADLLSKQARMAKHFSPVIKNLT
jgi:ribonuclease HI